MIDTRRPCNHWTRAGKNDDGKTPGKRSPGSLDDRPCLTCWKQGRFVYVSKCAHHSV